MNTHGSTFYLWANSLVIARAAPENAATQRMGCCGSKSKGVVFKPKKELISRQPTQSKFTHAQSKATAKFASKKEAGAIAGSPLRPKGEDSGHAGVNFNASPTAGGFDSASKATISKERPERESSRRKDGESSLRKSGAKSATSPEQDTVQDL